MSARKGAIGLVVFAYTFWGLQPLYWRELKGIDSWSLLAYRLILTLLVLAFAVSVRGQLQDAIKVIRENRQRCLIAIASAVLIGLNWITFVWAMGNGQVAQTGLGYFICPVLTMISAAVFLKERLRTSQLVGFALVMLGLALKVMSATVFPWVALGLAISFAAYLTLRKAFPFDPVLEMFLEMIVLFPLALVLLYHAPSSSHLSNLAPNVLMLLCLAGLVTAVPMLALVQGLKTVPLQKAAVIQYLTPSLSLLLGYLMGEEISQRQAIEIGVIVLGVFFAACDFGSLRAWFGRRLGRHLVPKSPLVLHPNRVK